MAIRARLKDAYGRAKGIVYATRMNRRVEKYPVDPEVSYPSYKSFDDIIDLAWLKSLDGYIKEKIKQQLERRDLEAFHSGALKQKFWQRAVPGALIIPLTKSIREWRYMDLNNPDVWQRTDKAQEFSELMEFIDTLPFKSTARIMIMCENGGPGTTAHRDHFDQNVLHEFLWFRSSHTKPFFMYSSKKREKKYVESYSAWFDTVNQYHGSEPTKDLSFSIRVDGTFSDELRKQIPVPRVNRASTPSLWAAKVGH